MERGYVRWDEAVGVTKRRRINAMDVAPQLAMLARMCHALLRHRRGGKTG